MSPMEVSFSKMLLSTASRHPTHPVILRRPSAVPKYVPVQFRGEYAYSTPNDIILKSNHEHSTSTDIHWYNRIDITGE